MKTAIDFYERGKLREANADEYNRAGYYSRSRFICPECGEPVYLIRGKDSNFFSHFKKTDISAECDRRVAGGSTISLYQRMGLPIYLRCEDEEKFGLYIGFKRVSDSLMRASMEANAFVVLDGKTKYRISDERFSNKQTTLIGIDYIPRYGRNYKITYLPEKTGQLLSGTWSDYADGFSFDGAIFSVTELGGKKIRHGDTISCNTEYYWVRKQPELPSAIPGINMQKVGILGLKDDKWYVYRGYFESSLIDSQYETLCQYLRNNLKIHLLEKKPEFIPMWPPVVKNEDGYVVDKKIKMLYGYIASGNEEPKVYEFKGTRAIYNELFVKDKVAQVPMDTEETVINIDRKYISNGVVLIKDNMKYVPYATLALVENNEDRLFAEGIVEVKSKEVIISSDNTIDIVVIRESGEIVKNVGVGEVHIDEFSKNDTILIIQSKRLTGIIYNLGIDKSIESGIDCENLWKCILINKDKEFLNIPFEIRQKLIGLINQNDLLDREIKRILQKNMISKPTIKLLESEGNHGRN